MGRDVAVKVIHPDLADDPVFVRRFENEARLVARLEHPHIVPLYDFWREPGGAYLVMRWLRGGTVEDRLVDGPLDLDETMRIVDQVGGALSAAHHAGVVHRDLKPGNLLLDDEGNVYLSDFGIAFAPSQPGDVGDELRSAGSPAYASPEQMAGQAVTPRSDIYSLGVLIVRAADRTAPLSIADSHITHRREARPPRARTLVATPRSAQHARPGVAAGHDARARPTVRVGCRARRRPARGDSDGRPHGDDGRDRARTARPRRGPGRPRHDGRARDRGDEPVQGTPLVRRSRRGRLLRSQSPRRSARVRAPRLSVPRSRRPVGSGKSSVVRARTGSGLPRRSSPRIEPVVRDDDGAGPTAVRGARVGAAACRHQPTDEPAGAAPDGDRGMARAVRRSLPSDATELVLVVDQFEELFTQVDGEERDQFLAALASAVGDDEARLRVVATVRADYFDRPLTHRSIGELMAAHHVAITPLSAEELERAVAGPAERQEPASNRGSWPRSSRTSRPTGGASVVAVLPDRALRPPRRARDDARRVPELGGVSGALGRRAEEEYESLDDRINSRHESSSPDS